MTLLHETTSDVRGPGMVMRPEMYPPFSIQKVGIVLRDGLSAVSVPG